MYYGFVDHPIKSRRDWEGYKHRLSADSPGRLPDGWGTASFEVINSSDKPVLLNIYPYLFWMGFYTMGMKRFLTAFYDDPDMMYDMFSFLSDFVCDLIRPILKHIKIDCAAFPEDLAFNTNPHISPRIYEDFWYPYQDKVVRLLQEYNVPFIALWSAGNLNPLLPGLIEHGINMTLPLECQARDMDPYHL